MDQITENHLILQEIFLHLPLQDLRNCRLVSRNWRDEAHLQFVSVDNISDLLQLSLKSTFRRLTIRNFPRDLLIGNNTEFFSWLMKYAPLIKSLRIQNIKWDVNHELTKEEFKKVGKFLSCFRNLVDFQSYLGMIMWNPRSVARSLVTQFVVRSVRNVHLNIHHNYIFDYQQVKASMLGRSLMKTFPNVESWTLSSANGTNQRCARYTNLVMHNIVETLPKMLPRFRCNLKTLCWIGTPREIRSCFCAPSGLHWMEAMRIQNLSFHCTTIPIKSEVIYLINEIRVVMKEAPSLKSLEASFKLPDEAFEAPLVIPGHMGSTFRFKLSVGNYHFELSHDQREQSDIGLIISQNGIMRKLT